MSFRKLFVCTVIFTAAIVSANPSFAQGRGGAQAKAPDTTDPRTARFGCGTTRPIPTMS